MQNLDETIISDVLRMNREERKKLQQYKEQMIQELSKCDRAISDLQHDIELSSLNAIEMTKDVVMLRKILRRRRVVKNTLDTLNRILQENRNKKIVNRVEQEVPHYKPRELKNLKVAKLA